MNLFCLISFIILHHLLFPLPDYLETSRFRLVRKFFGRFLDKLYPPCKILPTRAGTHQEAE